MTGSSRKTHGIMAAIDCVCALLVTLAAVVYGNNARLPNGDAWAFLTFRVTVQNAVFAGLFTLIWRGYFKGMHRFVADSTHAMRTAYRIFKGCFALTLLLALYLIVIRAKGPTLHIAVIFFFTAALYECLRVIGGNSLRTYFAARDPEVVIILGSGRRAGKAWRRMRLRYHLTMKLLGFVDDRALEEMAPDVADRYLGTVDQLSELLLRNTVDRVVVAMPVKSCYNTIHRAITIAEQVGVQVTYLQDIYTSTLKPQTLSDVDGELFGDLVPLHETYVTRQVLKRVIDIIGAAIGLVFLSPVFLIVAIAIKLTSPGPVFFKQDRYGHRRRLFTMYKFRSMVKNAPQLMASIEHLNEASGPIFKIRNDPRVTPLGRILRVTSLDELPQLWNVLVGDMSLVGPRPMSVRDVLLFTSPSSMRRFSVKPGVTGLWQVSGRSSVGFDQWLSHDFNYIDGWSLKLDLMILARTVSAVVKRSGAS